MHFGPKVLFVIVISDRVYFGLSSKPPHVYTLMPIRHKFFVHRKIEVVQDLPLFFERLLESLVQELSNNELF